jgi:hypothetical protein
MQAAERRRLILSMSGAHPAGRWVVFGCACGLGVLVLVVTAFRGGEVTVQPGTQFAGAPPASADATVVRSDVHRKMVFEDRRANFVARASRLGSASAVLVPHSPTTGP